MAGSMGDPEILDQAFQVLNTIKYFIEEGDVQVLIDHEIKNYFMMCQQVEIFQEKFLQKGWVLAYDKVKGGAFVTSLAHHKVEDDLGLLADRLLDKFCRASTPTCRLSSAVKEYLDIYGASRFTKFLHVMTANKSSFNLTSVVGRAYENGYNLEGPVFMDCLEHIALSPRGMPRVRDKINEFLVEDVSADTIVSMLAAESIDSECYTTIKHAILEKLEAKFSVQPKRRLWLLMVCSQNLLNAVNSYTPFMDFVLRLISSQSESIRFDPATNGYYSPPGCITYNDLVHIMAKFYRNPKTTQQIVNFVFNQFKADSTVWGSVLTACHNYPIEDTTNEKSYDSLYKNFTDPNVSGESLQLMLKSILNTDHLLMASALGWAPSKTSLGVKSDLRQLPGAEGLQDFSGSAAAMELVDASVSGPENIQIELKPSSVKAEFPCFEMVPCCQPKDLVPGHESLVDTSLVCGPARVAALIQTPNRRTEVELERRPLSSRVKRYPKRMEDFWA